MTGNDSGSPRADHHSISQAVVLMAGAGSRLRTDRTRLIKPLIPVLGRPLISYILETLARAGITTVYAIVGFERESLIAEAQLLAPRQLRLHFIENLDWQKQNGISALAVANHITSPFLLTMSDHLFDQAIVDLLLRSHVADQLNLAIDRKLDSIFDLDDAMKVQTRGNQVVALGKNLKNYDAIDTGLFVCPHTIFDYLDRAKRYGDCSLADGVQLMAADGKVHAVDIGDAWWQDVDTPEMLVSAEKQLRLRTQRDDIVTVGAGKSGDSA